MQVVVAEHDVAELAVAVGRLQRSDDAAIGHDFHLDAVGVGQRVEVNRRAVGQFAECLFFRLHLLPALLGVSARRQRGDGQSHGHANAQGPRHDSSFSFGFVCEARFDQGSFCKIPHRQISSGLQAAYPQGK